MTEDIKENRDKSQAKIDAGKYDVFLSYNHKDEKRVKEIGELLISNAIAPWLDAWDLRPGLPWQPEIENQIEKIPSAAIFIGPAGLGRWHRREQDAFLDESESRDCVVVPVFLPDAPPEAEFSRFLRNNTWIDFRKDDPDPLEYLMWAVTGHKPKKVYRPGVLVASLGDSPVVVSSMYDLLTKQKNLTIDRVKVLMPKDEEIQLAYNQVKEALTDTYVYPEILNFEDADSWGKACRFLQELYKKLDQYQKQDDSVYLSLAGGRKSMAALMAWVVPFFPCVKKLYHILDEKEENFLTAHQILHERPASEFSQLMHPDLQQLTLVEIPFDTGQQISEKFLSRLHSDLPAEFDKAEAIIMAQTILQKDNVLQVDVTKQVVEQFRELRRQNNVDAYVVRNGLLEMSQIATLQAHEIGADFHEIKKPSRITFHSFTGLQAPIHPIFYTEPEDIYASPDSKVERVIICSLETESTNGYRNLKEITRSSNFSHTAFSSIDELPPVPSPADSVLIVPLGKSPMIATQLYTLLTQQEQRTIHEVVLIYPESALEIHRGAELIKKVLKEKGIRCKLAGVPELDDIASADDCRTYQACMEDEIKRVQEEYPEHKIDLALSGGRKGMTAMTIFTAQTCHIPYVYHTLITNENVSRDIDEETTLTELNKISKQERNERLFLDAYRDGELYPYSHFALFRIPVFTADGW